MNPKDKIFDALLDGRLKFKHRYGQPTEGLKKAVKSGEAMTTYRPTTGLPRKPDEHGGYVRKLLNMDPEEFWLRQGWMQLPDGKWYGDTAMRDHIAAVEAQENRPTGTEKPEYETAYGLDGRPFARRKN